MSSITSMDEVVNILCKLSILHCKVLFGEAERFEEWLKEKGIKDKYAPKRNL
ncbi:11472_t:CDS:2 [Rhizophagus irregularis]|nr:11472_t:CDS:2 [Rhizophagus irregularis]